MPFLVRPSWRNSLLPRRMGVEDAVRAIKTGNRIFVQGMAATPTFLTEAMTAWGISQGLSDLSVYHLRSEGRCAYTQQEAQPHFRTMSFFAEGEAGYVPCQMHNIPALFRQKVVPLDVALAQVSPPDNHGVCSLGPSVDATVAAVQMAAHVIFQINSNLPRTHGDALVHLTHADTIVEKDTPVYTRTLPPAPSPEDREIGRLVAEHLVPDGATLQLGVGSIADMVLDHLHSHKDLGVHSEMSSDGVVELVRKGVINNLKKTVDPGRLVVSFLEGSSALFEFAHNNPVVEMRDAAYTYNPHIIMRQDRMIAIHSVREVDLTGRFDGPLDFLYGASMSKGGKAILALPSRTPSGQAAITPSLRESVVATRAHADYVATEYGIASLRGLSLRERVQQLVQIAHPEDRPLLAHQAHKQKLI